MSALPAVLSTEDTGGRGIGPGTQKRSIPLLGKASSAPWLSQNRNSLPDVRRRFGLQPLDPRMSSLAEGLGGRAQSYRTRLERDSPSTAEQRHAVSFCRSPAEPTPAILKDRIIRLQ